MAENKSEKPNQADREAPAKQSTTGKDRSIIVRTPQSLLSLSATAKAIMDELRDRHKGKDKAGEKPLHPTEVITLDKITDFLHKYNNLSEQGKSPVAIDQALRQLTDIDNGFKYRMLYLYPFLIRSTNKVLAKVALIAPQTTHEMNVRNYRESCFDYSKPVIDLILSNRAKRIKEIDENNPGNFLFQKNKAGQDWLVPLNCSLESEIVLLIKRGFKPYTYLPIKDFIEDFVDYGNDKNLLEEIIPGYHMIIDEIELKEDGTYQRPPEIVNHYRAQADGLQKFAMEHLRKLADEIGLSEFKYKLNEFQREHIDLAPANRKQNREKIRILINLIKEFPFNKVNSEYSKNVQNTCTQSIRIVEFLLNSMNNLLDRKYASAYNKLNKFLEKIITENTKNDLVLTPIDLTQELERAGIKEPEKVKLYSDKLKKDISTQFGVHAVKDESGKSLLYAVDQSYMASVLHKLTEQSTSDPKSKQELEYAKIINQEMILSKNPRLNINIKADHIDKLKKDMSTMEKMEREKKKKEEFQKRFNVPVGLSVFAILSLMIVAISFSDANILVLLIGLPISVALGILAAVYFRRKSADSLDDKNILIENNKSFKDLKILESDKKETKEEKVNEISRAAVRYVFPTKYNKVEDKVFDLPALRAKIQENLDDIKRGVPILAKEADKEKIASSIEYSILTTGSIVVAIPPEVAAKNKPTSLIFSKEDFKSPLFRSQLSEHYRNQLDKHKLDPQLVKYFTFLVNTVEVEYHKFLNRKIR